VRNPYKKAVSDYIWRKSKSGVDISFKKFLKSIHSCSSPSESKIVPVYPRNWPLYTIDDNIVVDYVARYENLIQEFQFLLSKVGISPGSLEIPTAKKVKDYSYKNYYDNETYELAASIFSKEIETFDYDFL